MKKKNLKLILLTTLTFTITLIVRSPTVLATTTLTVPATADAALIPGETFRINITVANVEKLGGFQLTLSYNTSILTATSHGSYPPFNTSLPSEINDTAGYVSIAYWTYFGDPDGFSVTDSTPIAWLEFTVDNYGISLLDLNNTKLSDVNGYPIIHVSYDGSFTNLVNIAVTNVTTSQTMVNKGDQVYINVTVANQGGATITFNVTVYYNATAIQTKTVKDLAPDTSRTIQFIWNTTYIIPDKYTIKAEAEILQGESNTLDNKYIDGTVTVVRPSRAPIANFTYSPAHPLEGETVTFNASLSTPDGGTIISYAWDFGDGDTETGQIVNHTYLTMGKYTVTLNVTDSEGKSDATQTTITVYRHDIAIVNVALEKTEVETEETLKINVTVANQGNLKETFDVTARYNETEIQTKTVHNLAEGNSTTLTFNWNTTNVSKGTYIISAEAIVALDSDLTDNKLVGGTITIKEETQAPSFTYNILAVVATGIIIAAIIVIYIKMQKAKTK